jgi:poly-beta-1,6-N-acetyl-D-glucosamine N-deacetylase
MTLSRSTRPLALLACLGMIAGCALILTGCDRMPWDKSPSVENTPLSVPTSTTATASPDPATSLGSFDKTKLVGMTPRALTRRTLVLMYHDVIPERDRTSVWFDCAKDEFIEQLDWLKTQNATFLSLEELHKHLTRGEAIPEKSVVLTFDDNYQGFYDIAYPILKERKIPAVMFVHTDKVGDKGDSDDMMMGLPELDENGKEIPQKPKPKKRAHMDWETLRLLDKEGLVTIGSHTLSHPEDMAKLLESEQEREMQSAKDILEKELDHPVPYFAYPNGSGDATTFEIAGRVGYTMAFTTEQGGAQESPGILVINRYVQTKMEKGWEACQKAITDGPAEIYEKKINPSPVRLEIGTYDGIGLVMVKGGVPSGFRSDDGTRKSVGEFIRDANANSKEGKNSESFIAGMNGTFFANALLKGTDNTMIGPCQTSNSTIFYPETDATRMGKIKNRPLVVWNKEYIAIAPFSAGAMNYEDGLKALVPGYTNTFLGGAWIVHKGVARDKKELETFSARDFNDPRKRAFFGISKEGEIVLGATQEVITTTMMARGAAAAGVEEAVLMDSGFSTSIIFDGKIMATGHTAKNVPSRPVPQAIIVSGTLQKPTDPKLLALWEEAGAAVGKISAQEAQAVAAPGATAAGSSSSDRPRRRRRR